MVRLPHNNVLLHCTVCGLCGGNANEQQWFGSGLGDGGLLVQWCVPQVLTGMLTTRLRRHSRLQLSR